MTDISATKLSLLSSAAAFEKVTPNPIADLESRLQSLKQSRFNLEMSDDRCYSNGRLRAIDDEMQAIRTEIAKLKSDLDLDI